MILTAPAEAFEGVRDIPVDELVPFANNPRSDLGDLTGLAASIDAVGIIEPLVIAANGPHGYTVVAGHRRLAAAQQAGHTTVPCVHRGFRSTAEMIELAAIENLQREGLTPLDEARAMQALVDLGKTQRDIAERIGCNQSHVSRRLSLVRLPAAAVELVTTGTLQLRHAETLAALDDADIDEVATLVAKTAKSYADAKGGMPEWAIPDAIAKVARARKHAKAVQAGKASKLERLKDNPQWGSREFEKCKKAEATHWYVGDNDQSITWARRRVDAVDGKPAKPDWQVRQERHDAVVAQREERLRAMVADDRERARSIGIEILVERAHDRFDAEELAGELGITVDELSAIEDADPIGLVALLAFAGTVHDGADEPYQYEGEWATRTRERWAQLLAESGAKPIGAAPGLDTDGAADPQPRGHRCDPTNGYPAGGDGSPPDAAEAQANNANDVDEGGKSDGPVPLPYGGDECGSEPDDVDHVAVITADPHVQALTIHDDVVFESPDKLQRGPWAGYRAAKDAALIAKIGRLKDPEFVRHVIAYEYGGKNLRRPDILDAALARLDELKGARE